MVQLVLLPLQFLLSTSFDLPSVISIIAHYLYIQGRFTWVGTAGSKPEDLQKEAEFEKALTWLSVYCPSLFSEFLNFSILYTQHPFEATAGKIDSCHQCFP